MKIQANGIAYAALAAVLAFSTVPARSYELVGKVVQPAAPNVEASVIHQYKCSSTGENGAHLYIYQYTARPGFRVINPPNWSHPIGGRDLSRFQDAENVVAQACNAACTAIYLDIQDAIMADRNFKQAYLRFQQNQSTENFNAYRCAEVLLNHLKRTAAGGGAR